MKKKGVLTKAGAAGMAAAMALGLCACQGGDGASQGSGEKENSSYRVTEENENQELVMDNQPESSYWFPGGITGVGTF